MINSYKTSIVITTILISLVILVYLILRNRIKNQKNLEKAQQISKQNIHQYKDEISGYKSLNRDPYHSENNISFLFKKLDLLYNELSSLKHVQIVNAIQIDIEKWSTIGKIKCWRRIINNYTNGVLAFYVQKYDCDDSLMNKYAKRKDELIDLEFDVQNYKRNVVFQKLFAMINAFQGLILNINEKMLEANAHNISGHEHLLENGNIAKDNLNRIKNLEFDIYSFSDQDRKVINRMLIDAYKEHDQCVRMVIHNYNKLEID